jgi:ankyrin repeat protein
VYSD